MRKIFVFFAFFSILFLESGEISVMHEGRVKPFSLIESPFSDDLPVIPDKKSDNWFPLSRAKAFPKKNISRWPDALYFKVASEVSNGNLEKAKLILENDAPFNPRFEAEKVYRKVPLQKLAVLFYLMSAIALINGFSRWGIGFFSLALSLHTLILILRIYILGRPPVSNMEETVLYVPWIGSVLAVFFTFIQKERFPLIVGSILAMILLSFPLKDAMENLQPVLNSRFWLTVHVLMIVASYGVLLFSGIAGHIYLFFGSDKAKNVLLPSLYIGIGLLIPGTILGGIWAAESWGRFWDWDPKEAWAFISAAIYLIFIHAYRYKIIDNFGLAMGSIAGLMAISFTWYGVNYILGTGLHSYGFGQGGQLYYWIFLGSEALIMCSFLIISRLKINSPCDK